MGKLNDREITSLLSEPIISFLTTLNRDGSPHTSPVWHTTQDGKVIVATGSSTVKSNNIANDPRVSLVAAADRSPQPWVQINGKAVVSERENIDEIVTDLAYHYLGPEEAPDYLREILGEINFVLIEIEPTRILGFDGEE